jgi:fatty-acyl-CoA synthase
MTLVRTLRERASSPSLGDEIAIRFKEMDGFVVWTWATFWAEARRVALGLLARGLRPGDHVMLLVPEPRAAVAAHFGVWAMGGVPTQVGLPYRLHDVGAFVAELWATGQRIDARALVMSRQVAAFAQSERSAPIVVIDDLLEAAIDPSAGDPPFADPPGPALIQLTSGSTGAPRGVVISHERLALHLDSISQALPATPACVGVTWLPLHHDMGLIGGLLYPFVNRFVVHVLSPLEFQARPFSWLTTMSEVHATHTAAPPSAFAVSIALARRAAEAGLDLSSLTCAMTGAEPVAPALLRRFSAAFAPTGFRPQAFFPVYGLAEATVAVTFPAPMGETRADRIDRHALEHDREARPADEGVELVSVGKPIPRTEIRIVGDDGEALPERKIGEILVRSATLMEGYYADPEATREAIHEGWLRTGDLGYVAEGDLFITGRKKEIIIKGGRNLAPAMLEEVAASVPGVRAGCVAAVGVRSIARETEVVWLLAETKADPSEHEAIAERVREALKAHGVAIDHVRLCAPGTLPKTTSGKIRRALVRAEIAKEAR